MFVTSALTHGGAERHAVTVMNRLAERGHEVHSVYLKDHEPNQLDRLRLRGGTVNCLQAARYLDWKALRRFSAQMADIAPTIVVAANPYSLMYAWAARRMAGMQSALVVTYHSNRLLDMKERLQMLAYRFFFWSADCLVFVCQRQRSYWLSRAVFSRRNEVIYNGVDTEEYRDRSTPDLRAEMRGRFGFAESDYVIGISAWLRPEKNHVQLVEAIARLRQRGIPAKALMIGDGAMRSAVEALARKRGVDGHIVITGFQKDVRPYICACDVMALCSTSETFSLAAIEAMALRKPMVHPDVGGAAEMIRCGHDGFLFPVGDTAALTDRLADLADREASATMGARARVVVETRFSEDKMIARYERLLIDIADGRQPERR